MTLKNVAISEEALIWAKVKKILKRKGSEAAIAALAQIRAEQILTKALSKTQMGGNV